MIACPIAEAFGNKAENEGFLRLPLLLLLMLLLLLLLLFVMLIGDCRRIGCCRTKGVGLGVWAELGVPERRTKGAGFRG